MFLCRNEISGHDELIYSVCILILVSARECCPGTVSRFKVVSVDVFFFLCELVDIQQLLSEAQHRWLRPAEICEILRNYQKFHIASEPPNRPPSMFFLSAEFLQILACKTTLLSYDVHG